MHPLTLWLTSISELGERERERDIVRRQHEIGAEPLTPLQRDGRWAAAMHRWAEHSEREAAARDTAARDAAVRDAAIRDAAARDAAPRADAPRARLGCA